MFLSLPNKRVPNSTSLLPCSQPPILFRHDLSPPKWPNSAAFFCHSQVSLTCLIYFSLIYFLDIFFDISFYAKSIFYTIRSMAMFLKVLYKVNFRKLTQT